MAAASEPTTGSAGQSVHTELSEFETEAVVRQVSRVATDVVEVVLHRADGLDLPPWTPGAHIDLILAPGPDTEAATGGSAEPLVRQYSLCGSVADLSCYRVAVLRTPDSRGGSVAVHRLTPGSRLRIRGPRNHFPLQSARRYLFVAGGIGITPLLPMIESASAAQADWTLHYGGRNPASMAYTEQLAAHGARVHLVPQDTDGLLDLDAVLRQRQPGTLVYCCGPEALLAAVEQRCATWPPGSLHLERFSARPRADDGEDTEFEVVLQRTGTTLTVPPGVSVFQAVRGAGVSVLGSCLEGICGTCEIGVLEGEVDHRDSVLDEEEQEANDCMMVCVSRSRTPRLVLDA